MMETLSWMLLILAIVNVVSMFYQLLLVKARMLIGNGVSGLEVWPQPFYSAGALVLAFVAVGGSSSAVVSIGYVLLALGVSFQIHPYLSIRDKNREHAAQIERATSAFHSKVDNRWASKR